MLLVRPIHDPGFLATHHLGVELHIDRDDIIPGYEKYIPFVHGVHLPYKGVNLASCDENTRRDGIAYLKTAIEKGCAYPVDRMVMHPCGIISEQGETVGAYRFLVDSLTEIADFAAQKNIMLCLENQLMNPPHLRVRIGCTSSEWFQLHADLKAPNIKLTFDSSHAATCCAYQESVEKRLAALWSYLAHPELIARFHWSDSRLFTGEAKHNDMHLVPGQGDLPREFHQEILRHPARKLLEQRCTQSEVAAGLEFIKSL